MKIHLKNIEKSITMFLILALSFNSFSAIVNDNDGSAFVTNKRTA